MYRILCPAIVHNVLQLGEGAENRRRKFRFCTNVANAVSRWLNYEKSQCEQHWRHTKTKLSTLHELRSFAKLLVVGR